MLTLQPASLLQGWPYLFCHNIQALNVYELTKHFEEYFLTHPNPDPELTNLIILSKNTPIAKFF